MIINSGMYIHKALKIYKCSNFYSKNFEMKQFGNDDY